MKRFASKRLVIRGVALGAASALALTACGSGGSDDEASALGTEADPITWMAMLHTPTTPEADGTIESALQEHTGTEVEFQWVPDASKDEKINAALASGSLADIVSLTEIESTTVRSALTSGAFWDVEDYLADYDNLSQIPEATLDSSRIDGELYGVPFQKPSARYGVLVRQDWLDNLGLEVPHTIDELTEVALAFANEDPDGNGEDDTVGFYDRSESFQLGFRSLAGYFGAGSNFEVTDDGQVVPSFDTDNFKEAMEWYKDLYDEGAVNQEFVTVQKDIQRDGLARGKGGIVVTGLFDAKNLVALAQDADPETPMEWALLNDVTKGDVPRRILSDTNGGMGGWMAIPKSEVETEDDLRTVLGFIDGLMDPEAFELMTNGIEGETFEMDDSGEVTITDQTTWEQEVQPFSSSRPSEKVTTYKSTTPYVNEANEKMAENEEYVVINPAQSLTSETYDRQWSTLEQAATDAYNKYMSGQLDMAGYEDAIDGLRGQGLDKVVEELSASYAESNG